MKIKQLPGLPVIEASAEELIKLATAAAGAVKHEEAVVFHGGKAQIGIKRVDALPGEQR